MALPFPQYSKVKHRYCIAYFGPCADYIVQLLYVRPAIEKELPGIEIYLCCRDDFKRITGDSQKIIFTSEWGTRKREVAYLRELRCNMRQHPVLELIEESNLQLGFLEYPQPLPVTNNCCVICPKSILSIKPIPNIEQIKNWVSSKGFIPTVSDNISQAGWVVGAENEQLFTAAVKGIKTTLLPTGLGTALYKKLFPSGEIYGVEHI
jgi:hypothetical protein